MSPVPQSDPVAPRGTGDERLEADAVDASGRPVFAPDGTDLTVIRWMLEMSPEQRIQWLQSHLRAVATIRRDQPHP